MIPNCEGCKEELNLALYQQDDYEFHLATTDSDKKIYPFGQHHFALLMVDDNGEIVIS